MLVHVSSAVRWPSHNYRCIILTTAPHLILTGSLSRVASLSYIMRCYTRIPDGPTALSVWTPPAMPPKDPPSWADNCLSNLTEPAGVWVTPLGGVSCNPPPPPFCSDFFQALLCGC